MKYTFQDSTDLPLQRDFIQDLNEFIEIAKKVIPMENSAIELNEDESEEVSSLESRILELDKFSKEVQNYVDELSMGARDKEILECRNSVIDACVASSTKGLKELNLRLDQTKRESESGLYKIENDILVTLNPLFKSGSYGVTNRYYVSMKEGMLRGTMKSFFLGMEYTSELTYMHDVLTVKDVYGDLFLPTWTKAGILHKENKVKMLEVSEFIVTYVNYDGIEHIDASFESKKKDQKFRVSCNADNCQIYCGEIDITADETLLKSVKLESINALMDELKKYIKQSIKSQNLTQILLDGKDAVRNNEVFDCLKLVAEQYGEVVKESLDRGYVKNEITIKIESSDGTRTEKYITREEAFDRLSEIGSEGLELASILNLD
ncbi:hypothetical protein [Methanolobus halotolerans]|uniref:Chromosome segregation ATPase n=1 Tax=Methanolobus halotolerans TaxID=2052935 RepID=A0A4E0PZA2_9EURY|nr:hypothetical protein [Methanolobus halotolerans]TGC10992.1 hypothetical protein CUN85_02225 [Methanolobus halotolerans]